MLPLVANHESGQQEAYDAAVTEMLVNACGWLGLLPASPGFRAAIARWGRPALLTGTSHRNPGTDGGVSGRIFRERLQPQPARSDRDESSARSMPRCFAALPG